MLTNGVKLMRGGLLDSADSRPHSLQMINGRVKKMGFAKQSNTVSIAIISGAMSVVIGFVAFALSWNFWQLWGGPLPGLQLVLFPGNLTLVYLWHPLFTEEINFWPKLALLMAGQFAVVASVAAVICHVVRMLRQ